MTIAAILKGREGQVISIGKEASVADAIALLAEKRIGALPVVDGSRVLGIFSERDVIYCLASAGADALGKSVAEVMTAPAETVESNQSVLGALGLMTQRRFRHLPVVEGDSLVGFVSIGDLVKHRIEKIEAEAAAMRDYIQTA
jgi:CBS domain-containing protein